DMIAGPSEILIINDGAGDPRWMALDLLSQAEHDELASSILITTSRAMAEHVSLCVQEEIERLEKPYARKSIENYGIIVIAKDIKEACMISNEVAPEHLELFVKEPEKLLRHVKNAGCIFLGSFTPEATGDYLAGPNHTLPTGGTARFSSPLGVYDFMKRTSIVGFSEKGIKALGNDIARFAEIEGLQAHAKSARARAGK
ncbi:MAG: histidinol dehydrogenase, partial [Deltaproteobacteria bacterium]